MGGTGITRRFDIGYEEGTGDAMVAYSTNTATNNELAYRTKPGGSACGSGNWSTATIMSSARTAGIVQWVEIAEDERAGQNILAMAWEDSFSALSAMLWNGTAWVNEPTTAIDTSLERVTTAGDTESFDLSFESLSGSLMVVWGRQTTGNNANGVWYRRCTGGTAGCTWAPAATNLPAVGNYDDATNLDISSNPSTNEIVFASIGNQRSDLQAAYWSGTTWTTAANLDTACVNPTAGSQKISTGWITSGATKRSIIVYNDTGSGNVNWVVGNSASFIVQADTASLLPVSAATAGNLQLVMDPKNSARLLFLNADSANDLIVKRLDMTAVPAFTWTDANASTALELNLSQNIGQSFEMAFWRNP